MAEALSFRMVTEPFEKAIADRQVRMRRAAMWSVREGGRVVKRDARQRAPVLARGAGVTTFVQMRRGMRFRAHGGIGPVLGQQMVVARQDGKMTVAGGAVSGLLKGSITPSRRLKTTGEAWSLKVGPRGLRVHLYAGKEEARERFMVAAYQVAVARMPEIHKQAVARVWKA